MQEDMTHTADINNAEEVSKLKPVSTMRTLELNLNPTPKKNQKIEKNIINLVLSLWVQLA